MILIKQKNIRSEIKKFLQHQNIEKISHREYKKLVEQRIAFDFGFQIRHEKAYDSPKLTSVDVYEIQQSHQVWYDHRIGFLEKLVWLIDVLIEQDKSKIVLDSGCASGIDLCFLAQIFPRLIFRGYDIQKEMIILAKKRRDSGGLENLTFYQSDNQDPKDDEIEFADLIYNCSSLIPKLDNPADYKKEAMMICKRLRSQGHLILAGIATKYPMDPLIAFLEENDLTLEREIPYKSGGKS